MANGKSGGNREQQGGMLEGAVREAYAHCRLLSQGSVADYIPELARVDPERFAIAACTVEGEQFGVGDLETPLTLQSMSKPFVYARALELWGLEAVHQRVGVEPTGDPFDSIIRLDAAKRPHNPLVNAGALAVSSLLIGEGGPGEVPLVELFSRYAGRPLSGVHESVYRSEKSTGHRNRAIAHLLRNFRLLAAPVEETLELYFRQCSVEVTTTDLAVMAATLAHGGANPLTAERVLPAELVAPVLTLMFLCGLYDDSGDFALRVGLPAKSGVSGGILAVAPGRFGLAAFSPRLDPHGNTVRGTEALRRISERMALHTFSLGAGSRGG